MIEQHATGLNVFGSLKAEFEPWLPDVFVKPPDFDIVTDLQSVIVWGDTGSGKTALKQAVLRHASHPQNAGVRLLVEWMPRIAIGSAPATVDVIDLLHQMLEECMVALVKFLLDDPARWEGQATSNQNAIIWFVREYLRGDWYTRLELLANQHRTPSDSPLLNDLLHRELREPVLYEGADPIYAVLRFGQTLTLLGMEGIWILVDGLERYLDFPEHIVGALRPFLSALEIFEQPGQVTYKLFLPRQIAQEFGRLPGLERRRFQSVNLQWTPANLTTIAEARLALATGRERVSLANLCAGFDPVGWLTRACGLNPQRWLDQIQPLARHLLNHTSNKPLPLKTWTGLYKDHPPQIFMRLDKGQVRVGHREVSPEDLPQQGFELLAYLYERPKQVVSKAELYFCALQNLPSVPRGPADPQFEHLKAYEGMLNTLIYRVRQAIEPDPSAPILLVTVRGKGLKLAGRW